MTSTGSIVALSGALSNDSPPDNEALGNIAQADLIFYRNVEIQTALIQNYRNAILEMAVNASHAAIKNAKAAEKAAKSAGSELSAAGGPPPNEGDLARQNLANVVAATNLLMLNCVTTIQQLDIMAQAALAQSVTLVNSSTTE